MESFMSSGMFLLILVAFQSGSGGGNRLQILGSLSKEISSRDWASATSFSGAFLWFPTDVMWIPKAGQWSVYIAPVVGLDWAATHCGDCWGMRDPGMDFSLDPLRGGNGGLRIPGVVIAGLGVHFPDVEVISLMLDGSSVVGVRRIPIWDPGGIWA